MTPRLGLLACLVGTALISAGVWVLTYRPGCEPEASSPRAEDRSRKALGTLDSDGKAWRAAVAGMPRVDVHPNEIAALEAEWRAAGTALEEAADEPSTTTPEGVASMLARRSIALATLEQGVQGPSVAAVDVLLGALMESDLHVRAVAAELLSARFSEFGELLWDRFAARWPSGGATRLLGVLLRNPMPEARTHELWSIALASGSVENTVLALRTMQGAIKALPGDEALRRQLTSLARSSTLEIRAEALVLVASLAPTEADLTELGRIAKDERAYPRAIRGLAVLCASNPTCARALAELLSTDDPVAHFREDPAAIPTRAWYVLGDLLRQGAHASRAVHQASEGMKGGESLCRRLLRAMVLGEIDLAVSAAREALESRFGGVRNVALEYCASMSREPMRWAALVKPHLRSPESGDLAQRALLKLAKSASDEDRSVLLEYGLASRWTRFLAGIELSEDPCIWRSALARASAAASATSEVISASERVARRCR